MKMSRILRFLNKDALKNFYDALRNKLVSNVSFSLPKQLINNVKGTQNIPTLGLLTQWLIEEKGGEEYGFTDCYHLHNHQHSQIFHNV